MKTYVHEKLLALKIKSEQGVPTEIAGTTLDFIEDKVINLIPKPGVYIKRKRCKHMLPPESSH